MAIETQRTTPGSPTSVPHHSGHQADDRPTTTSIMLFDLSIHGHHPAYIRHIIQYWHLHQIPATLNIVVSPQFLLHHADVVELALQSAGTVRFVEIAPQMEAQLQPRTSGWKRLLRSFQEWQVLCKYAQSLQADHCLVMYFDTCQMPMVLGQKPPCPISGIYFKPTFHYPNLMSTPWTWKQRLQQWREKVLLKQVLRHSQLHTLFNLDPLVGQVIDRWCLPGKTVDLPDPVSLTLGSAAQVAHLRQRLQIGAERQVFLLFGALNRRKGIYPLLEAIAHLPEALSEKMCLLLVGQANESEQVQLLCQTQILLQSSPVQIISHYEFVPEAEVPLYFQLADVVLAPYQKHVGMSGILIWAAAAQKPVLSSDYGLMGELVRRYQLGLAIDSSQPTDIARGLTQFLQNPTATVGNPQQMQQFAHQNSAAQFAQILCQRLLPVSMRVPPAVS